MSRVMLSKSNSSTSSALLIWWDNARWYRNCLSFTTSGLLSSNSERWRYKMWQGTTLANFPILRTRIPLKIYLSSNRKSCAINNQVRMLCNNSKSKHQTSFISKELRWTVTTIPSTMKLDSLTQHRASYGSTIPRRAFCVMSQQGGMMRQTKSSLVVKKIDPMLILLSNKKSIIMSRILKQKTTSSTRTTRHDTRR